MQTIIEGVILGLTLSIFFSFGPALVAEIQTSILRGFWAAVLLAFGVFLSDALLVALGFLGAVQIFESNKIITWFHRRCHPDHFRHRDLPEKSQSLMSTAIILN